VAQSSGWGCCCAVRDMEGSCESGVEGLGGRESWDIGQG